ncbi:RNA dependent RNA polymerase-domain-containing protein [Multifurca ochricompacta]|uniref:RNA-dependent RNA polymerase n=1 Tax=Multifurca ochricompacta TaxID=376703 RepID=A0AAD4MAE3_9AGAM|nr:RNA dependent RNA polymerase-domain-containing protein [Multifurca ochricompacta]
MEINLRGIDFKADLYDIYEAVEAVLHGPKKPNFEVVPGVSFAGRIHDGTAILRVPVRLGKQLLRWFWDAPNRNVISLNHRSLRLFDAHSKVPLEVKQKLEKVPYINPRKEKLRKEIEDEARQFGVWYTHPDTPPNQGRTFSVEHECEFLSQSAAYINLVYERSLICIDIGQRETEETNNLILVKFSSIHKLGIGFDASKQPFIIFDLYTPPSFEQESYNNRMPEGIQRNGRHKTRDRISALDNSHARIAEYAHHLRVILANHKDLLKFEEICQVVQCQPLPTRVHRVDAYAMRFFRQEFVDTISCWIRGMDWRVAFQIEAYLRCGLPTTFDLLVNLQEPIEGVIRDYGSEASELLRRFSVALQKRNSDETPSACLARVRAENRKIESLRPPKGTFGAITRDPTLAERFVRVEFRDEDHLPYRWDGNVDGTWILQQRVGKILRDGFELSGRRFEFLAYSASSLREHTVWFVAPFHDPVEGIVNAESIRASLGDFSELVRTPSKYAARIAQAFTATDPSVIISRDQWEEQEDLGPHTDGVGTISPDLADMIWDERCRTSGNLKESRVKPSAYQFRFLGYKGVVVVDSRLKGIRMRLRKSQRKFLVHNVTEAGFEIARSFDYPNPVHLNKFAALVISSTHARINLWLDHRRPIVMALEDRGVKKSVFIDLQNAAKAHIYLASDSLKIFAGLLKSHGLGSKFNLTFILEQLIKHGLEFKGHPDNEAIRSAFLGRLVRNSINHSLRDLKFKARIPVPQSYQLVGVADEGQAYINEGVDPSKVFTLKEGFIYVCVQEAADKEPEYFKGTCLISRSPVIHPGDGTYSSSIQRVYAVGKPPDDKICFFRGLKNVVVLPAVAEYPPGEVWTLNNGRGDATVQDICDFFVEYIHSDVMGLLADRHITIADQSKDGVFDKRCMKLVPLCSKAVDYAKNGMPVDLRNNLPRTLIKFKPDWHRPEVTGARDLDYYVSDRALGFLFREIDLHDPNEPLEGFPVASPGTIVAPLEDPISRILAPLVHSILGHGMLMTVTAEAEKGELAAKAEGLHARYVQEIRYTCMTHTLVEAPDVCLTEEEVVLGTILANCTRPRWRLNRMHRLKLHSEMLVRDIRADIISPEEGCDTLPQQMGKSWLCKGLRSAWDTWVWTRHNQGKEFIESFSLIALEVILDCLQRLAGWRKGGNKPMAGPIGTDPTIK